MSPSGSSIGCEQRLIKRRSQVRIPPPPTLVWTCQKKKILPLSFCLFFFFLLLISIYIPMLFCKFYIQFRKKMREILIVFHG
jgi:hypothetical protein